MAVILLNCITLGMYQPCSDLECSSTRCKILEKFDHFIFAFFAAEMIVKIIAMGVYGKYTYLDDSWNRLDCFIVIAGAIEYGVDSENLSLSAIRTIRVLRPLRAINRIPSMRILVMLLLDTLPMLWNVLLLCFFVFFIFGIIGVQLWAGVLRNRCFLDVSENISYSYANLSPYYVPKKIGSMPQADYICSKTGESGMRYCSGLPRFEYEGIKCNASARPFSNNTPTNDSCVNWNQYYTNCTAGDKNPFQGGVSFDNIGLAWVAIFQVISLESWVNIMYYVQDAHSFWDWIYFVALIVIGSFFMINLCLVVIATQFSETKKRETERMMQERKRFQSSSTLASNSEPGGCYAEILKYLAHCWRRAKRKVLRAYYNARGKTHKNRKVKPELSLRRKRHKEIPEDLLEAINDKQIQNLVNSIEKQGGGPRCHHVTHDVPESEDSESKDSHNEPKTICGMLAACKKNFQQGMKTFVEHRFFRQGILTAILINTLSMGIEYHNQPEELTEALEYSNLVFSILFAVEMFFKLCAYGFVGYIQDGFNVFDGFIVILSMVELTQQGGASGLSVLRTFRLLRILKLVRFLPALRRQLVVMLRTMDNVATFFALLVLFIFIFSILGMNLFGCKFCKTKPDGSRYCNRKNFDSLLWAIITVFQVLGMNLFGGKFCWRGNGTLCTCLDALDPTMDCQCERANFNTLLWSVVTVFQVLTQEDWNTVLYNGMQTTSAWASLYFIALMTLGNYVLFNLLVAILVEGFSTEEEEKKKMKLENKEKELQSILSETNNNEEKNESIKLKSLDIVQGKINNTERAKMLGVACQNPTVKDDNAKTSPPTTTQPDLNPPIITHTAATPMPTPQGSPNEHGPKECNKVTLCVHPPVEMSTLSVRSSSTNSSLRASPRLSPRLSPRISPRPSPCLSPCLRRSLSSGSRSNSWRRGRSQDGDRKCLVPECKIDSMDTDDDEVFQLTCPSPTVNRNECNGHLPLNNQRTLSPQNSIKRPVPSPRNSFKTRNNSCSSTQSNCNSILLSRQNSFNSRRTLNSLSSMSAVLKEEVKQNNLTEGTTSPTQVEVSLTGVEGEEDPDAIDETNCSYSWCPEPHGCFKTRHEHALYLLAPNNALRRVCHHLMAQQWFDNTVLFFIALNCITLAMERPNIPPDSVEREFLNYSNYVFTCVFTVEMMIKVLAKGLVIGQHAYLKSGWNVMDGFLVVISLVDILISISADSSPRIFGILRVFRLLRTLRPLRVISRAPGLKLVVQTLLSSLRPIGNIVLICCTFFIIFGILGVQLFKGTFYYCKGPNVQNIKNKTQCLTEDKKNVWINQKYNFDDLGQALMALFVLASKDGWVSIMYTGLDAVGVDQQPIENYSEWRLLYFISFLLLVGFFVLNMFVGVVVENFHKCRQDQEIEERERRTAKRKHKMEQKKKSESKTETELNRPPYWADYSASRLIIHQVVNSKYFDLAIAMVIGLNVITMAMEYYMMPAELEFALKIFNYFFTSVFIIEASLKILALGLVRYIKDRWNQLDMFIVILSIVGIILEEMKTNVIPINPTIIRVMRVLRIARVLKLLKMAKGIRALLDTVIQALPQVGNLALLFFLLFFIFAALGVELFGRLECSEAHPCEGLGEHAHFKDFGMAFLTLFRVATGDNWNGIMKDTLRDDCDSSEKCLTNCCVSTFIAPVFFVVFVLMAQFVLVNVVVAVLMKHLEETYKHKEIDDELEAAFKMECSVNNEMLRLTVKESHRLLDDDGGNADDQDKTGDEDGEEEDGEDVDGNAAIKEEEVPAIIGTPRPAFPRRLRTPVCKQISLPPSFTFRPPSNEPPYEDDKGQLVPVDITISNYGSSMEVSLDMSGSSLDIPPSPYSSSYSDNSSYAEPTVDENTLGIPRMTEESHRKSTSPQQKQRLRDRKLVRQKSCEYESPPATAHVEPIRTPNIARCEAASCDNPVSMSQPMLNKNLYEHGEEGSKVNKSHNPIIKLKCLHRSQSSGSEKVRLREKHVAGARVQMRPTTLHALVNALSNYSQEQNSLTLPNVQVTQNSPVICRKKQGQHRKREGTQVPSPNPTLPHRNSSSKQSLVKRSSTYESDSCELSGPDWAAEEAACDEEVRLITGDSTDHDDIEDLECEEVTSSYPLVNDHLSNQSGDHLSIGNSSNSQDTLVCDDQHSRTQRKSYECCVPCESASSIPNSPSQAQISVPSLDPCVLVNPPSPDKKSRRISLNSDSKESQSSDTDLSGAECPYDSEEPMLDNSGDLTPVTANSGACLNVPVITSDDSCVRRRTPNLVQQTSES
ncbi:voltage-dependent T-type calcium channel subunit alpha-1H-like [Saccostrea echinata]|uniref:voltage-dependent T-type calcium channel subunit alpha-1H-like n=1 Tax=Saccostrea echinata TaxID=191078 RepID=UPI002A83E719|nr:voltage-dependent T-type calcium channel subunit alpha-1H-like [Saccostrea echinata]